MARNQVVISGELIALDGLRYTPGGVARVALTLSHTSQQTEANKVRGFLAQQSSRSRQLVLHINDIILE
ncbi:MAG: hypothetical protein HYZ46_01825 [Nitrosomonadales bacterium]|nr:hypothetical protein [Nitrosomonadales bacterium]